MNLNKRCMLTCRKVIHSDPIKRKNIQKRVYNSKDVFDKSLRNQFSINGIVESFPGIFSISWTNFLEQHSDHIFWCKI